MGRHKTPESERRFQPEKLSLGIELMKLPPALPNVNADKTAKQFYEYIGGELIASGKLATTDIFTLQMYCIELSGYVKITKELGTDWTIDGSRNKILNPLVRVQQLKLNNVRLLAKELGLTPYTRGLVSKVTTVSNNQNSGPQTQEPEDADLELE